MSVTTTKTTTFTATDIRKVVDNFAADFSMMAQSTGLRSRESVVTDVSDLKIFAEHGYLVGVSLFLFDKDKNKICAARYKVSESATGWQSDRPGDAMWPKTEGGSLRVIATLTDAWWSLSEEQRKKFIGDKGLHSPWSPADYDTSFFGLKSSSGQKYASNGYGWERTNYSSN